MTSLKSEREGMEYWTRINNSLLAGRPCQRDDCISQSEWICVLMSQGEIDSDGD